MDAHPVSPARESVVESAGPLISGPQEWGLPAEPDREEVLRLLGIHRAPEAPAHLMARLDTIWDMATSLLHPRVWDAEVAVSSVDARGVTVGEGVRFRSPRLARALRDASAVRVFVATVGEGLERLVERWAGEGRLADAFLLDAFASAAAECLVERYHRLVGEHAARAGFAVTLRFSPGYCDWPLEDQRRLFSLFQDGNVAVTLTPSCFMQPRKSVSGVFGIVPLPNGGTGSLGVYNPCRECGNHGCPFRRRE
ncbi:MAG: hypothetical protein D6708_12080 [Candidatus Dadabacteria bacterium]|nr:MAG: hypothetical protein D6708_12080 [Candidatus Dadabacteria bacterium]